MKGVDGVSEKTLCNTAVGSQTLSYITTGDYNVAVGFSALNSNSTGFSNSAVGENSLYSNTTGVNNAGMGAHALFSNITGSNNTAIGHNAFYWGDNFNNSTALGANAGITADNQVRLGNTLVTSLFCNGAYEATTALAPNLYVDANGQIMHSTASGASVAPAWEITGNAGTIDGTNFIGTTDNVPFNIRVNNEKAGRIEIGANSSVFLGHLAGNSTNALTLNVGVYAPRSNTAGEGGVAIGLEAMRFQQTGDYNTAVGLSTLRSNISGNNNVAIGSYALNVNTVGANTAVGTGALMTTTTGSNNSAQGYNAGGANITGSHNTYIGYNANCASSSLINSTAIGSWAEVNASNKVRIGNTSVTVIEGQVDWSFISDKRFKNNIEEDVIGLDFIMKLRPVTYNIDVDKTNKIMGIEDESDYAEKYDIEKITQSGFIAQEIEVAANEVNYNFNGVHVPEDENGYYSVSYGTFVVPLVKATQEQQVIIGSLQQTIGSQQQTIDELQNSIQEMQKQIQELQNK